MFLHLIGTSVIAVPTGRFNYQNYDLYEHVVEATLACKQDDSITVVVTRVLDGPADNGDSLTFSYDYRLGLEPDQNCLFIADTTDKLSIYGLIRDGYYIMVGRSSPNILTEDDLESLSSGEVPEFNDHSSEITVHFPLTSDEEDIRVRLEDGRRITESGFHLWDDVDVSGNICTGPGYSSVLEIYLSREYGGTEPITFSGDVRRYRDDKYYLDLWPVFPAVTSTEAFEDWQQHDIVPFYTFSIDVDQQDSWPAGLPEDAYLLSNGRDFYLTGRRMFVSRRDTEPAADEDFQMKFCPYATTSSHYSTRKLILEIENIDNSPEKPLLMTMLEAVDDDGCLEASLYLQESDDAKLVFFSECTLSLCAPSFTMEPDHEYSDEFNIDRCSITFDETGAVILDYRGHNYPQINHEVDLYIGNLREEDCVIFEDPHDDDTVLLLYFTSLDDYIGDSELSEMLMTRVLDNMLWNGPIQAILYRFSLYIPESTEIAPVTLQRE
ncbi:MAG: hypothetical protein R6U39_04000 [Candidatus Aegiribacteria sp.]